MPPLDHVTLTDLVEEAFFPPVPPQSLVFPTQGHSSAVRELLYGDRRR